MRTKNKIAICFGILLIGLMLYSICGYAAVNLNTGLKHAWTLQNTSGIDSLGNKDLVVSGGTAKSCGVNNNGLYVSGSPNYFLINATNTNLYDFRTSNMMICFWVNATIGASYGVAFNNQYSGGANVGYWDAVIESPDRMISYTDNSNTNSYTIPDGQPFLHCVVNNGTAYKVYQNGTFKYSLPQPTAKTSDVWFNRYSSTYGNTCFDEIYFWNDSNDYEARITELWNGGTGTFYPFPTGIVYPVYSGLTTGQTNNTKDIILNVSCTSGNITLWFDQNTDPITKVYNNYTSPYLFNFSPYVSLEGDYYLKGSCDSGANNGSVFVWTYDTTSPDITINPTNSFNTYNTTILYSKNLTINVTGTDNIDLFGFEFLISNSSGSLFYNKTNLSLTGLTTYTWQNYTDINNWRSGTYYWNTTWADSHTNNDEFADGKDYYLSRKSNKEFTFETWQNNKIDFNTKDDTFWNIETLKDRKSFTIHWQKDWFNNVPKKKIIELECDNDLKLMNTKYNSHFVCINWKEKNGNWIDFENDLNEIPKITEKKRLFGFGNKYYEIEFNNDQESMTFNSIGGLNVNTLSGSFNISNFRMNSTIFNIYYNNNQISFIGYANATEELNNNILYEYKWYKNVSLEYHGLTSFTNVFYNGSISTAAAGIYHLPNLNVGGIGDYELEVSKGALGTKTIISINGGYIQYGTSILDCYAQNYTDTEQDITGLNNIYLCALLNNNYYLFNYKNNILNASRFPQDIIPNLQQGLNYNINNLSQSGFNKDNNITLSVRAVYNDYATSWLNYTKYFNFAITDCNTPVLNVTNATAFYFMFINQNNNLVDVNLSTYLSYYLDDQLYTLANSNTNTKNYSYCVHPQELETVGNFTLNYIYNGLTYSYYGFSSTFNNVTNNINLTVLDNPSEVIATVYDEINQKVENCYIYVQKYNSVTGNYDLSGIYETNFEGQVKIPLILNTVKYRFLLYYPSGTLVETTNPTFIYSTAINFQIVISREILANYYKEQAIFSNLTFNDATNNFRWVFNDPAAEMTRGCLYVYRTFGGLTTEYNNSCVSGSSGTVLLEVINESGVLYTANGFADIDSETRLIDTLDKYFPDTSIVDTIGQDGFIIDLILTIVFAFVLTFSLPLGIILIPIPSLILAYMGLIAISVPMLWGIEIVAIIIAVIINYRG